MLLIYRDGRKVPICRACRKLHSADDCPRAIPKWDANKHAREFWEKASAYQAELLRRNA